MSDSFIKKKKKIIVFIYQASVLGEVFATSELNLFISSYRVQSLRSHSIIMPSENHDPSFDYEEEVDKAKRFKDDLDKGGWKKTDTYLCDLMQEKIPVPVVSISKCLASLDDSVSQCWIKTFPGEEVPIKLLFKWKMPIPAKTWLEMIQPAHTEVRRKWDDTFVDHKLLETFPNGENVV